MESLAARKVRLGPSGRISAEAVTGVLHRGPVVTPSLAIHSATHNSNALGAVLVDGTGPAVQRAEPWLGLLLRPGLGGASQIAVHGVLCA